MAPPITLQNAVLTWATNDAKFLLWLQHTLLASGQQNSMRTAADVYQHRTIYSYESYSPTRGTALLAVTYLIQDDINQRASLRMRLKIILCLRLESSCDTTVTLGGVYSLVKLVQTATASIR